MDPRFDSVRVVGSDGAAADLQILGRRASPGQVVLWLPAMGVAARHYLPFAHSLSDADTAVALHEWRGNGSSDRRAARGSDWGYRELLDVDLPASLASLRERFPAARVWLGGHSLGGQLAALFAALRPGAVEGLLLIASGAPYWRCFHRPWPLRGLLWAAPHVAAACGFIPGRRLGFGGNEAVGVIRDWSRSGLGGRYVAAGLNADMEVALERLRMPVLALQLQDDWLAPAASRDWLRGKMGGCDWTCASFGPDALQGARADHFAWMKQPDPLCRVVTAFVEKSRKPLKY